MNEERQLQVSATKVLVRVQGNEDALPLKYVTYYADYLTPCYPSFAQSSAMRV